MSVARQFWLEGPGRGAIRRAALPEPGPEEALFETLWSGVSRGTERLVAAGQVPPTLAETMRAPFQQGAFPFPVSYGYAAVGVIRGGAADGRLGFALAPHHDRIVLPQAAVRPLPAGLPPRRAVLAANMETALNALWDAPPLIGDRVAVVGGGVVGLLTAVLAAGVPGARVELVDVDPARGALAAALGLAFRMPDAATGDCDLVLHASATDAGLAAALALAGDEAEVVELSWHGDRAVAAPLGAAFHQRRLVLRSSQVGRVAPARRARRTHADRLDQALELLRDDRFDALLGPDTDLDALPDAYAGLLAAADGRMPVVAHAPAGVDHDPPAAR